jgi:hypothetical protein
MFDRYFGDRSSEIDFPGGSFNALALLATVFLVPETNKKETNKKGKHGKNSVTQNPYGRYL